MSFWKAVLSLFMLQLKLFTPGLMQKGWKTKSLDRSAALNKEHSTPPLLLGCCASVAPFYLLEFLEFLLPVPPCSLLTHGVPSYSGMSVWQRSEWGRKKQKEVMHFLCNNFLYSPPPHNNILVLHIQQVALKYSYIYLALILPHIGTADLFQQIFF